MPELLMSDNGTEFMNEVFRAISDWWQIERRTTLPYHSRANGLTERYNRTITELTKRIVPSPEEWDEALKFACYAYNNSPHGSTGETPFYLAYGREERLPSGLIPKVSVYDEDDSYKNTVAKLTREAQILVREKEEKERSRMKESYDKKHRHNALRYPRIGDRVYMKVETNGRNCPKMVVSLDGPYRVVDVANTTATIKKGDNIRQVQFDRLRIVEAEDKDGRM